MNFSVWRLSDDSTKILLVSAGPSGVCVVRVACEDIRQEFGVRASNELLYEVARARVINREILSEIANSLFEAGQDTRIQGYLVVDISRGDLAARRKEFAWGEYAIPEAMGIPAPSPRKMAFSKFELERDIVEQMLRSLGYRQFFLCDPNTKTESGADVLVKLDGRLIGFQVTQYHSDVGENAGTTGSSLRREESRKAAAGLPAPAFIKPISVPALVHLLREKLNKGWSQKDFPDMRLLIAASIPQSGGTASTFLFEARLNVNEMNAQLSPILEHTKYSAAYLYVMMPESVHRWTKKSGWENLF